MKNATQLTTFIGLLFSIILLCSFTYQSHNASSTKFSNQTEGDPFYYFSGQSSYLTSIKEGSNIITICGLPLHQTFSIQAIDVDRADKTNSTIVPIPSNSVSTSPRKGRHTFESIDRCMNFEIRPQKEFTGSKEIMINLKKFIKNKIVENERMFMLMTEDNNDYQYLVEEVFISGGCFEVENFSGTSYSDVDFFTGEPLSSIGTFSGGAGAINIASGIVLSTGDIGTIPPPNAAGGTTYDWSFLVPTPDNDLAIAAGTNQNNIYDLTTDLTQLKAGNL